MQVIKCDGTDERQIMTAMIVCTPVLARISSVWKTRVFRSEVLNTLGKICVDYYNDYKVAPAKTIEQLIRTWAEKHPHVKETIGMMESMVGSLSQDYEKLTTELNPSYEIDRAQKTFELNNHAIFQEEHGMAVEAKNLDKAKELLNSYRPIELSGTMGVNPNDLSFWVNTYSRKDDEVMIRYPKASAEFFGEVMSRKQFVSFVGPEKSGKSFFLLDAAYRAVQQKRKVLYFEAGDMSQEEVGMRLGARVSRRPISPRPFLVPEGLQPTDQSQAVTKVTKFRPGNWDIKKSPEEVHLSWMEMLNERAKTTKQLMQIYDYGANCLSVAMMRGFIEQKKRDGWHPDVIIIDYADILMMPYGGKNMESRDKIFETWKDLRAMAKLYDCLVLTATQSNRQSYNSTLIKQEHITDDKRKLGQVSAMISINANDSERENSQRRLAWLVNRHSQWHSRVLHCAGCYALSHPMMRTLYQKACTDDNTVPICDDEAVDFDNE